MFDMMILLLFKDQTVSTGGDFFSIFFHFEAQVWVFFSLKLRRDIKIIYPGHDMMTGK